jgi:hypothetical protein
MHPVLEYTQQSDDPHVTASAVLFATGKARRSLDLRSSSVTSTPLCPLPIMVSASQLPNRSRRFAIQGVHQYLSDWECPYGCV